jgi:creatinine amidohydrolase/Fe(II)-dependent formamide hydrolase-like protein
MAFPGTITLTPKTLQHIVYEVVQSLYRQGWRKVFILNGHGGNNAVVDIASIELRTDFPTCATSAWRSRRPNHLRRRAVHHQRHRPSIAGHVVVRPLSRNTTGSGTGAIRRSRASERRRLPLASNECGETVGR